MVRTLVLSIVLIFLSVPSTLFAAEYINSFESAIYLRNDSSLTVSEQIEYVTDEPRHGIVRTIARDHPDASSSVARERYTDIVVTAVTQDGQSVPYEVTTKRDEVIVRIGDPNKTATGTSRYEIAYTVSGAISYVKNGGADLYWNVTGNDWSMPIKSASARVSAEAGILRNERSCYFGLFGEASSCESRLGDDGVVIYTVRNLKPGEGLTIAHAVERTSIERVILERWKPLWLWIPGLFIWFLGLGYYVYRYRNAHETGRTIIPQYEPYPNVKPMYAGLLFDGDLDVRDITAGIVYLAEQGYIKINKIEQKIIFFFEVDDYEIMLVKDLDESVDAFSRDILTLLLGEPLEVGGKITLSKLKKLTQSGNREKQKILTKLRSDVKHDLEEKKFFQSSLSALWRDTSSRKRLIVIGVIVLLLAAIIPDDLLLREIFIFGTIAVVSTAWRQRTRMGFEALDHLKGFKLFLETTDKDRYDFHNAPEKSPQQFMEYLPYAIAFGVEEKWAEVFKDITIPAPNWYSGDVTTFNAVNLTHSLSAFSTAFAASSSGGSASSGGGFSGGGAGGGGGSSW